MTSILLLSDRLKYQLALVLLLVLVGTSNTTAQINCVTPTLEVASETICTNKSIQLQANTNAEEVYWYNTETSTTPIEEGYTFQTPLLTENTNYWVKGVNYEPSVHPPVYIENAARYQPVLTTTAEVVPASSPWGLTFDVFTNILINSVDVYNGDSASRAITLHLMYLNDPTTILATHTEILPAGNATSPVRQTIQLGFEVPQGSNYRLVASESPYLIRELSGSNLFPSQLGSAGVVTSGGIMPTGTLNTNVYYFFYNWNITANPVRKCETQRLQVPVLISDGAAPTGNASQVVGANGQLSDLVVQGQNLQWYSDALLTIPVEASTVAENGMTYFVTQKIGTCESAPLAVTVFVNLGVEDFKQNSIQLFPNPVVDVLTIAADAPITKVAVYNLLGQQMEAKLVNNQLDVRGLTKGTYVVVIDTEAATVQKKITKL
jgi:hypothetical protein